MGALVGVLVGRLNCALEGDIVGGIVGTLVGGIVGTLVGAMVCAMTTIPHLLKSARIKAIHAKLMNILDNIVNFMTWVECE
jgi:uncharacterized membrane protein YeaQ/YmgE (transglycosylase-associated protein family)